MVHFLIMQMYHLLIRSIYYYSHYSSHNVVLVVTCNFFVVGENRFYCSIFVVCGAGHNLVLQKALGHASFLLVQLLGYVHFIRNA